MIPHETTSVSKQGENVCLDIPDAQDHQPADMGINPRGTPSKEKLLISLQASRSLMENYAFHLLFIIFRIRGSLFLSMY